MFKILQTRSLPLFHFSCIELGCDVKNDWSDVKKNSDIDMYLFIEKGLIGGISYIAKRYNEANNKHMKNYDLIKQSKYISYLDMNNLCVWGMSQFLSFGRFKWLKSVDNFDVNSVSENNPVGYILDVDLEYPEKLHKSHNDLRRDSNR